MLLRYVTVPCEYLVEHGVIEHVINQQQLQQFPCEDANDAQGGPSASPAAVSGKPRAILSKL